MSSRPVNRYNNRNDEEPEALYESSRPNHLRPQPTRQIKDQRDTSAYDVYDSYFGNDPRQSGMGAVGLGFMNGTMDDEDSDDEDNRLDRKSSTHKGKNAALAEATRQRTPSPPPMYAHNGPIAAPKPGYAAPIAALNLAKPEQVAMPAGRQQVPPQQPQVRIPPHGSSRVIMSSPSPIEAPTTPHPLDAPPMPIAPAFARPRPAKQGSGITFEEKSIMRGESEDNLIPRRGERGDDFWRRFSMVVRTENMKNPVEKESAWLRKTQSGSRRLATWVWVVGIILVLAAAGGIGIGVYVSQKNTGQSSPKAFGGSANEGASSVSSSLPVVGSGNPSTVHSSFHVTPTNTVARREYEDFLEFATMPTDVRLKHRRLLR